MVKQGEEVKPWAKRRARHSKLYYQMLRKSFLLTSKCEICGSREKLEIAHISKAIEETDQRYNVKILCREHHREFDRLRRRHKERG